jgi:putative flippase GtrA
MLWSPLSRSFHGVRKLLGRRVIRFLVCGVITAAFNILLLALLIESFRLNHPAWRNLANFISIEISVLFSFVLYRLWVWSSPNWTVDKIVKKEIPLYHLSCGTSIATRSFILFPLLDWLGINYTLNSLIGIGIGSAINYVISDRIVFKRK